MNLANKLGSLTIIFFIFFIIKTVRAVDADNLPFCRKELKTFLRVKPRLISPPFGLKQKQLFNDDTSSLCNFQTFRFNIFKGFSIFL